MRRYAASMLQSFVVHRDRLAVVAAVEQLLDAVFRQMPQLLRQILVLLFSLQQTISISLPEIVLLITFLGV